MDAIKLTKTQKAKLLEMCNKLFPKKGIWFAILDNEVYYSKNGKYPGYAIPWFELCWKLLHKITENKSPTQIVEKIQLFGMVCFNQFPSATPIDYLYSEFKKLKL